MKEEETKNFPLDSFINSCILYFRVNSNNSKGKGGCSQNLPDINAITKMTNYTKIIRQKEQSTKFRFTPTSGNHIQMIISTATNSFGFATIMLTDSSAAFLHHTLVFPKEEGSSCEYPACATMFFPGKGKIHTKGRQNDFQEKKCEILVTQCIFLKIHGKANASLDPRPF